VASAIQVNHPPRDLRNLSIMGLVLSTSRRRPASDVVRRRVELSDDASGRVDAPGVPSPVARAASSSGRVHRARGANERVAIADRRPVAVAVAASAPTVTENATRLESPVSGNRRPAPRRGSRRVRSTSAVAPIAVGGWAATPVS
jgi:hypothetical protein